MSKRKFEMPVIESYLREELVVETAFAAELNSLVTVVSDRRMKHRVRALRTERILAGLFR